MKQGQRKHFKSGLAIKTVCKQSEQNLFGGQHWLDHALQNNVIHFECILYALSDSTAAIIVAAIQGTLARLNLALNKSRATMVPAPR